MFVGTFLAIWGKMVPGIGFLVSNYVYKFVFLIVGHNFLKNVSKHDMVPHTGSNPDETTPI